MDDKYQHEKELCGELVPRLFDDDVWEDIARLDLEDTILVYRQARDVIHKGLFDDLYNDTTFRKDVFEAAAARLGAEVGRKFMALPEIYTLIDNSTLLPALDKKGGIISHYDHLFMTYSRDIRWDWRLMAAQCYQESTFDPKAVSFAGAKGLMQIMPGTADHLGLARDKLYDPESNIRAAAKYIAELQQTFSDIRDHYERTNFVLASYNGGSHHIRDAMALAKRDGKNPHRWADVSAYVLKLANPRYYNDPIVKNGYMRGSETVDYVAKIRQRHAGYQGVKSPHIGFHPSQPRKADKRKNKYDI